MSSPAPSNRSSLFALILAAGRSRRFGRTKQIETVAGIPLVRKAMLSTQAVLGARTVVVLGHEWHSVYGACQPMAGFAVLNDQHSDGLSTSIAAGIRRLPENATGALLMLADQPAVDADALEALVCRWEQTGGIVCSRSSAGRSPPAIFPARLFDELSSIGGDRGAKRVIERHEEETVVVDVPNAAYDVDVPEDLQRFDGS